MNRMRRDVTEEMRQDVKRYGHHDTALNGSLADDDKLKEALHQTMVGIIVLYERVVCIVLNRRCYLM